MIRQPAVAGSFYAADQQGLNRELDQLVPVGVDPMPAKGIIVPHAGYIYSGAVAGEIIATTEIPQTVILLGPNHHGRGAEIAVSGADGWATPLGVVPVDEQLKVSLCAQVTELKVDDQAHQLEHSLEVMLPFLLRQRADVRIVPIALRSLNYEQAAKFGCSLAEVLKQHAEDVLLLASSDMNHFLDADATESLDYMAISAMTSFDPKELYQTVVRNRISMCGMLPAVVVMHATTALGASECQLVRYAHSGQVNGDNSRVVGYASLSIT